MKARHSGGSTGAGEKSGTAILIVAAALVAVMLPEVGRSVPSMAIHLERQGNRGCASNLALTGGSGPKTTLDALGKIDAFVLFYGFGETKAVSLGLTWPEAWGNGVWTDCGTFRMGTIASPGDATMIAWEHCVHDSLPFMVGWLSLTASTPGTIRFVASESEGAVAFVDCDEASPRMHEVMATLKGGVGGMQGDDPSALFRPSNRNWRVRPDSTGDLPTPQDALRRAIPGDTILVQGGIYKQSLILKQGVVVLGSWDKDFVRRDIAATPSVIDATGLKYGVKATFAEDSTSLFDGFVIRGSAGGYGGGVVAANGSSPRFRNLILVDNSASIGGGIFCHSSSPVIEDVLIARNKANVGGGMYCAVGSSPRLVNVTFVANEAAQGAAVAAMDGSSPYIEKSVIAHHSAGDAIYTSDPVVQVTVACTDLWSNLPSDFGGVASAKMALGNNISEDPGFADVSAMDFTLREGSPILSVEGCGRLGSTHTCIPAE